MQALLSNAYAEAQLLARRLAWFAAGSIAGLGALCALIGWMCGSGVVFGVFLLTIFALAGVCVVALLLCWGAIEAEILYHAHWRATATRLGGAAVKRARAFHQAALAALHMPGETLPGAG